MLIGPGAVNPRDNDLNITAEGENIVFNVRNSPYWVVLLTVI